MQIAAHARDELRVNVHARRLQTLARAIRRAGGRDLLLVLRSVQVRHLARVQDIVDVFQEGLAHDLRVGEEEDGRLVVHAGREQALFEVLVPVVHAVGFAYLNLMRRDR